MTVAIVAFTGGLDSTWCLYDILRKDKFTDVVVMQAAVGGPATQYLAELFARRAILKELNHLFPDKTIHEYCCPMATIYPNQVGKQEPQLVQQLNTYMALFRCAISVKASNTNIACVIGWHKEDVFENDPNEGTMQEYLDQYKNIIGGMYKSVNLCSASRVALITPAWDKTKLDMWTELPRPVRNLITVADGYDIRWVDKDNRITVTPYRMSKSAEYDRLGIIINTDLRYYHLDHLTNMDLWAVHIGRVNGYLDAFIGDVSYLGYLYMTVDEKLGKATKAMYGFGSGASGMTCMGEGELATYIKDCNRGTTETKDNYDDLFNGTHKNEHTDQIDIQSRKE